VKGRILHVFLVADGGQVKVFRRAKMISIEPKFLARGDIIFLEAGAYVPADIRIIECSENLHVDMSNVTGEIEPQRRRADCTDDDPMETQNLCFFGTLITEGEWAHMRGCR
jgi:sodium/potassium-transporting ATPase subunit alpha